MLPASQNRAFKPILMVFGLFAISCDQGTEVSKTDATYFPIRVSDFRIYHVNETQITAYNIEQNFAYELKTVVTDSFLNVEGGYSYQLYRSTRPDDSQPWQALDTWTVRVNTHEVVITEGSIPFVRLTFPVKKNRTWNGNKYNDLATGKFCTNNGTPEECDPYVIEQVGNTYTTATGLVFDDVIEVIQSNDPDIVLKYDVRSEVYTRGIGLIAKESVIYNYCAQSSCQGQQLIESGVRFKQELVQYGRE